MIRGKKRVGGDFWFKGCTEVENTEWGWVPINWKGWVALILLVGVNVFAANYFQVNELVVNSLSKFGIVFLISFFVFITIARRKTQGVKIKKK